MNHYIQQFYKQGISLIPLKYQDKRPEPSLLPNGRWEPYQHTPNTEYELSLWFSNPRNYGVVCGWQNLVVLDFDDWATYNRWAAWAIGAGPLPRMMADSAFRVATSRGVHLYIRTPLDANRKLPGLDIKTHGYVVGPLSIHPCGKIYEPLNEMIFPYVPALSDILPAEWLASIPLSNTELRVPIIHERDIWEAVNAGFNEGKDVIGLIREKFRIESFFINRRSSDGGKGRWWMARCPFHDDHHPSLWIDAMRGICQCYVCHDKPLDVINLYAALKGMSNEQAIRVLAKML